ncbi:vomeronasal 1 receptor monDomV1R1263 [Monodelphis domestica]|uniref:Vomeronasal type-1 receptor n=1 Tax=Monodelphis domestica TaxID=13616 RepID=A0A5F8GVA6_MONDO|nr:vomeronasal 1 receptor monDomV1R1263 [Monodelphis domestica]
MLTYNEILGIIYLYMIGFGFLGNCILLFLNIFNFLIAHRTKSKSLIIIHLAFSNIMSLLFRGLPATTRLWRVKCLLDNIGIKIITHIQIITWSLSMGSTCLLSTFQAISLIPNNSKCSQLKTRTPKFIILYLLLFWVFNLLLNEVGFLQNIVPKNITDINEGCNTGYRRMDVHNKNHMKIIIILCVYDALFICLMICSSGYMVLILYRHKKHVRHIHSNSVSIKLSPETRATLAILFLVCTFVLFNTLSPIFILYMFHFKYTNNWMIHSSVILSVWYPAVSPFILIIIDNQIPKTCTH